MASDSPRAERTEYELVDAGELRRLERFGGWLVDRPAPTAIKWKREPARWAAADLRFDPGPGWTGRAMRPAANDDAGAAGAWTVAFDGLAMELKPTDSGGLGVYPEHLANLPWLEARIRARMSEDAGPQVLNLFAHTGLLTLAAARAGAAVAHLDGARSAVAWARRNAELSGLADRPIRWIVDDALAFVSREGRRGRRYDGIVLDPPSFGHAKGRRWRLDDELPELLGACRAVASDDAFVLLTAHTAGLDGEDLAGAAQAAFGGARFRVDELSLTAASGARLDLGWSVRRDG